MVRIINTEGLREDYPDLIECDYSANDCSDDHFEEYLDSVKPEHRQKRPEMKSKKYQLTPPNKKRAKKP